MAIITLRPSGRPNPELTFRGKTKGAALSAAKSYMRSHNVAGFKDEDGVFHPIRSPQYSPGTGRVPKSWTKYSRARAGEGPKHKRRAKKNPKIKYRTRIKTVIKYRTRKAKAANPRRRKNKVVRRKKLSFGQRMARLRRRKVNARRRNRR